MAKNKTVFFCTSCGNETPKWMGRCPGCGAYNTMEEYIEKATPAGKVKSAPVGISRKPQHIFDVENGDEILVDLYKGTIYVNVTEEKLQERKKHWMPYEQAGVTKYLSRYSKSVSSSSQGAILES